MRRNLLTLLLAACAVPAHAAHPLISEDTGTQGTGHVELEVGNAFTAGGAGRVWELDPQLSYGVTDTLDAIVRPSLFRLGGGAAEDAGRRSGFGTTALDVKWRFWQDGPLSFGTRAGLDLPTATHGFGQRGTGAHALAMVTYDGPLWLTANLAWVHVPDQHAPDVDARRNLFRVSAAAAHQLTEQVRLVADVAAQQSGDRGVHGFPAVALAGVIVKVTEHVDADVGYQARLSHDAPANVWLAGVTFRW